MADQRLLDADYEVQTKSLAAGAAVGLRDTETSLELLCGMTLPVSPCRQTQMLFPYWEGWQGLFCSQKGEDIPGRRA